MLQIALATPSMLPPLPGPLPGPHNRQAPNFHGPPPPLHLPGRPFQGGPLQNQDANQTGNDDNQDNGPPDLGYPPRSYGQNPLNNNKNLGYPPLHHGNANNPPFHFHGPPHPLNGPQPIKDKDGLYMHLPYADPLGFKQSHLHNKKNKLSLTPDSDEDYSYEDGSAENVDRKQKKKRRRKRQKNRPNSQRQSDNKTPYNRRPENDYGENPDHPEDRDISVGSYGRSKRKKNRRPNNESSRERTRSLKLPTTQSTQFEEFEHEPNFDLLNFDFDGEPFETHGDQQEDEEYSKNGQDDGYDYSKRRRPSRKRKTFKRPVGNEGNYEDDEYYREPKLRKRPSKRDPYRPPYSQEQEQEDDDYYKPKRRKPQYDHYSPPEHDNENVYYNSPPTSGPPADDHYRPPYSKDQEEDFYSKPDRRRYPPKTSYDQAPTRQPYQDPYDDSHDDFDFDFDPTPQHEPTYEPPSAPPPVPRGPPPPPLPDFDIPPPDITSPPELVVPVDPGAEFHVNTFDAPKGFRSEAFHPNYEPQPFKIKDQYKDRHHSNRHPSRTHSTYSHRPNREHKKPHRQVIPPVKQSRPPRRRHPSDAGGPEGFDFSSFKPPPHSSHLQSFDHDPYEDDHHRPDLFEHEHDEPFHVRGPSSYDHHSHSHHSEKPVDPFFTGPNYSINSKETLPAIPANLAGATVSILLSTNVEIYYQRKLYQVKVLFNFEMTIIYIDATNTIFEISCIVCFIEIRQKTC